MHPVKQAVQTLCSEHKGLLVLSFSVFEALQYCHKQQYETRGIPFVFFFMQDLSWETNGNLYLYLTKVFVCVEVVAGFCNCTFIVSLLVCSFH